MAVRYLTVQEVIFINATLIKTYSPSEQIGVRSMSLLESAVYRPQQTVLGKDAYPSVFEKAAALFQSLGQNHPFQNGNKRTAFAAMVLFLRFNGYFFKMDPKQAEDFTVAMVEHAYRFEQLVDIIKGHSSPI